MVGKSVKLAFAAAALASSAEASPFGWRPPFWFSPESESATHGGQTGFWPGFPGFGWHPSTGTVTSTSAKSTGTSSSVSSTAPVTTSKAAASSSLSKSTISSTSTLVSSTLSASSISTLVSSSASKLSSSSASVVISTSVSTSASSSSLSSSSGAIPSSKAPVFSSSSGVISQSSATASGSSRSACSLRPKKSSTAGSASASKASVSSSASKAAASSSSSPPSGSATSSKSPVKSTGTGSASSKSACSRRTSKSSISGSASASKSRVSSSASASNKSVCTRRSSKSSLSGSASASKSTRSASASASVSASVSKPVSSASASASISRSGSKSKSLAPTGTSSKARTCTRRPSKTGLTGTASATKTAGTSTRSTCSRRSRTSKASGSASLSSVSRSISASLSRASGTATRTVASGSVTSSGFAPSGTSTSLSPCGSISKLVATSTKSAGQAYYTVPAQLGLACLESIPFNSSAAVAYLDAIRPYLNWQSTLEYLKDPPAEYAEKVQPAYDFRANFERIYSRAIANSYSSEYTFGFDVYTAFQTAHDGHFVVYPDSVAELITFGRTTPLVSVSVDGQSIPEVFVYSDVVAASFGNSSFTPSAITEINGQDSTDFLLAYSEIGSLQDRDALWNNIFYEPAQVALGTSGTGTGTFTGSGRGRFQFPGSVTSLTFANGTTVTNDNFARVLVSFANITNGEDLYQQYLVPPPGEPQGALLQATSTSSFALPSSTLAVSAITSSAAAATTGASAATSTIPAPGYPSPYIREKNNLNSGYFLSGPGYDDVAVLAVNSFVGSLADEIDFQAVNTYLINQAVKFNKTKLIIDVSANGGGTILQGYDLFKQLFPSIEPYGAQRFRAHEAVNLIGQEFSAYAGTVPRSLDLNDTAKGIVSDTLNYRTDLDVNLQPFTSWAEKYGPFAYGPQPDNFSSLFRWNLNDPLTPENSGGIYVSGYLNRTNITMQPFAAENIVVVTDGYCASTCTIFSDFMRQQGNVKYVALGGRPNKDITQAVGGVKGTNDLLYADILADVEEVFVDPLLNTAEYYNSTVLGQYSDLAIVRSTAAVINFRDGIRKGDASQTPLQFIYEPADCRIYYTPEMTVDISASWRAVADSAWNGINHCIAGSLAEPSSKVRRRTANKPRVHSSKQKREILESVNNAYIGQGNVKNGDSIMII